MVSNYLSQSWVYFDIRWEVMICLSSKQNVNYYSSEVQAERNDAVNAIRLPFFSTVCTLKSEAHTCMLI